MTTGKGKKRRPNKKIASTYLSKTVSKYAPFFVVIFLNLATLPSTKSIPAANMKNINANTIKSLIRNKNPHKAKTREIIV